RRGRAWIFERGGTEKRPAAEPNGDFYSRLMAWVVERNTVSHTLRTKCVTFGFPWVGPHRCLQSDPMLLLTLLALNLREDSPLPILRPGAAASKNKQRPRVHSV